MNAGEDLDKNCEDLLMTVTATGEDLLATLMTTGEDLLMSSDDNTDYNCDDNVV
jgi:hypothetical protein